MLKKLKDITLEERNKICEKQNLCIGCPFNKHKNFFGLKISLCSFLNYKDDIKKECSKEGIGCNILETEIEVEE